MIYQTFFRNLRITAQAVVCGYLFKQVFFRNSFLGLLLSKF